ncbi:NAD(P)-binding domain-containing protein [Pseudomonas sp. NPDC007930]|uniref:NAD(P)-dependent oxidoreductase n=1 Tax=Pseudomonas sp. NPDC007930 TaxID=3364417 RepID=UPI0036EB20D7
MSNAPIVGFIGVGVMGQPMALHLLAKGHTLHVYDRSAEALAVLEAAGAQIASSARAVAEQASVVFTSLPNPAILEAVVFGPEGLAEGRAMKVLADLSTVGPELIRSLAERLAGQGVSVVDAPISGGAERARSATLAVMMSGAPEALRQVMDLAAAFGTELFNVGEQPGQAQLLKLLNNMLSSTALLITAEAFVAGVRGGLDPQLMIEVFNAGTGKNGSTMDKFPRHVLTGSFDFGHSMAGVCKDVGLAVDACQALGVPMWLGNSARQLWTAAAQGGARQDMTAVVKTIEGWAGAADTCP